MLYILSFFFPLYIKEIFGLLVEPEKLVVFYVQNLFKCLLCLYKQGSLFQSSG